VNPPRAIEVLEPGLLTTIQDPRGRRGWRRYGVPGAGALDPLAGRLANRLAGNDADAGLLEVTLAGPRLRLGASAVVALAGADLGATIDGRRLPPGQSRPAPADAVIGFGGRRSGARAYLAFDGGIEVEPVLGSRATDLRSRFGGLDGRALRPGDRLRLGPAGRNAARRAAPSRPATSASAVRVLPGPHLDRFAPGALERLCDQGWTVSPNADRMGCRLDGGPLEHGAEPEVPSLGLPLGAIQVPPDGRPIVALADRPVTGGYPVLAVVARADIGLIAQRIPGDTLSFRVTTSHEALDALAEAERGLSEISIEDEDAAWAGALE
jgi:antagonist of KipI